jgi:hypothetical protein
MQASDPISLRRRNSNARGRGRRSGAELGPSIAYDEKAHAAAQKAVKEFFAATLLAP